MSNQTGIVRDIDWWAYGPVDSSWYGPPDWLPYSATPVGHASNYRQPQDLSRPIADNALINIHFHLGHHGLQVGDIILIQFDHPFMQPVNGLYSIVRVLGHDQVLINLRAFQLKNKVPIPKSSGGIAEYAGTNAISGGTDGVTSEEPETNMTMIIILVAIAIAAIYFFFRK